MGPMQKLIFAQYMVPSLDTNMGLKIVHLTGFQILTCFPPCPSQSALYISACVCVCLLVPSELEGDMHLTGIRPRLTLEMFETNFLFIYLHDLNHDLRIAFKITRVQYKRPFIIQQLDETWHISSLFFFWWLCGKPQDTCVSHQHPIVKELTKNIFMVCGRAVYLSL